MAQLALKVSEEQLERLWAQVPEQTKLRLLDHLAPALKIRLVRRWKQETWPKRLQHLVAQIDRRVQRNPRVIRALLRDAQEARRELYATKRRH